MSEVQTDVEARVKTVISEQLCWPIAKLTPEQKIVDNLGADSLDSIEMVMALEDEFGIEIRDEEAETLRTVGQVIDAVCSKVS